MFPEVFCVYTFELVYTSKEFINLSCNYIMKLQNIAI